MITIKRTRIKDKIYFKDNDVDNLEALVAQFTYWNKTESFTSLTFEKQNTTCLPSNTLSKLNIENIIDERTWEKLDYSLEIESTLRPYQQDVVDKFKSGRSLKSGIIQAKCGWGKTYTACSLIEHANTKAIILVHTKLLFYQWIEELENQFPHSKIGRVGDSLLEIEDLTVAIYKSASNNINKLKDNFSLVIVDEVHRCPAATFSKALNNFSAKIKIGMSATPYRTDGKHVMLKDYFTDFLVIGEDPEACEETWVNIIQTDIPFPVRIPKKDWAKALTAICSNAGYIDLIAKEAIRDISNGRCILILSERLYMLEELEKRIPNSIRLVGGTDDDMRSQIIKGAGTKYDAILSTKIFDEGVTCYPLDTLITTCPSNLISLEQRVGRIQREYPGKKVPLIKDMWLVGPIVMSKQRSRLEWYHEQGYKVTYG